MKPAEAETRLHKLRREIAAVFLFFLAGFGALCLFTYHPNDPSLNHAQDKVARIHNAGGVVGSYLADILYQGFGSAAYLFVFLLGLLAYWRGFKSDEPIFGHSRVWLLVRATGFFLLLLALSAWLGLWPKEFLQAGQPVAAGGLLGKVLAKSLRDSLNPIGAYALTSFLLLVAVMLAGNLSLREALSTLGQAADRLGDAVSQLWTLVQERRRRKSEVRVEKKRLTQARSLAEPVISAPARPEKKKAPPKETPKQETFDFDARHGSFKLPPLKLLESDEQASVPVDRDSLLMNARLLEKKLLDFGVTGQVVEVMPGPVITMYEFRPAAGVKINKIANLADDIALAMSAISVRIIAPIPGKDVVGIEIPNKQREMVYVKEIITSREYENCRSYLPMALGKDIVGEPFVFDLRRSPHLLVAGATGAGKSVSLNAMIMSVLYRATPDQVRLLMIDPKRLELSVYEGIPHLLHSVIAEPKEAAAALRWAVAEMGRRYSLLAEHGVRNVDTYNKLLDKEPAGKKKPERRRRSAEEESTVVIPREDLLRSPEEVKVPTERLPLILIVIDELSDLMIVAARDCEESICRLAQMARAAGIHLIVATQRPSVDVITGLIKANFPSRISFQVSSRVDSRTILDQIGSERLLGNGDMLWLAPGTSRLIRVHGAYISEKEIHKVVEVLKKQGRPVYDSNIVRMQFEEAEGAAEEIQDELYESAVAIVAQARQASISMLQRRLRVGYNRAARMIERMEAEGLVGPQDGVKPREVFVDPISLQK